MATERKKEKKPAAPLKRQLLTMLLGTVLPIFLGMAVINSVEFITIRDQVYTTSQDALSANMRIFDSELKNAAVSMVGLDYDEDNISQFESSDSMEQYYAQAEYMSRLSRISSNLISGYGVYCPLNDSLIYIFDNDCSVDYRHRQTFTNLIRQTPEVLTGVNWHSVSANGLSYLVYSYQLRDTWFFCWAEVDYLLKLTDNWLTTEDGGIILLGTNGEEMTRDDSLQGEAFSAPFEGYSLSQGYLVFGQTSETGAYRLVEVVSVWELIRSIFWVLAAVIAVMGAFLLSLPFLIHSLNRRFFVPMDQLQYAITRVNKGILDYRIPEDHTSIEFHKLIDSFNGMVAQIQNLKVQTYEDQIAKSRIQMQYMQVQVEPHFYLNALNTINAMAQVGDDELIQKLTRCLSDYMRFIASSRETVTIAEELKNIDNYLEIMKIRRGDSFIYRLNCQPDVMNIPIPPLLVQTPIENIMKYAFNAYGETRFEVDIRPLRLSGKNGVQITVTDNGKGYPEDYAARFNAGAGDGEGRIGLQNARTRLRYLYGQETVFHLSNREEGGAKTLIWFPIDRKEGNT